MPREATGQQPQLCPHRQPLVSHPAQPWAPSRLGNILLSATGKAPRHKPSQTLRSHNHLAGWLLEGSGLSGILRAGHSAGFAMGTYKHWGNERPDRRHCISMSGHLLAASEGPQLQLAHRMPENGVGSVGRMEEYPGPAGTLGLP